MKALVKTAKGAGNLALKEVEIPEYHKTEVLIQVKAVGLCGSDIHLKHDLIPYNAPIIIGHEFCGEIVAVGADVQSFQVGDRVVAENIKGGCGKCELCRSGHQCICQHRDAKGINSDGGMAEYVVCDEKQLYHLPDSISYEEGALMEPVTVCCHAVLEQNHVSAGDKVLVMGPGAIGLIAAMLAKANGAEVILCGTEKDKERLQVARQLEIPHVVQLGQDDLQAVVAQVTRGQGVDAVIECSGSVKALESALWLVKFRGCVTQVGLFGREASINMNLVVSKEIQIRGSLSHSNYAWNHAIQIVEKGLIDLKPLITHQFKLEDWEAAFQTFEAMQGIKILLRP